ncbi:ankyrin repeat domain-containing protein 54-like isoform X1 [Schistocerca piceifrons]|uniref:ankyrin repeat domain-containing protein 54-like isoform X1 n=1 Tax=Schistocerca piceifrons TaxID=274613 RepID=UPI001F5F18CB|nr:ankyrin repeat domain-containing protein 54-like isoform X1 [Schistocerca piceifrons]
MTSVDSGVETGNDSNDSCATHDPQSPTLEITPAKLITTTTTDIQQTLTVCQTAVDKSCSTTDHDIQFPLVRIKPDDKVVNFLLPLQRPIPGIDPPAGLTFCNVQRTSLGLGNGYEVVRAENKGYDLTAVYQKFELQRKLRAVRCRLKTTREAWLQFKGPLSNFYERKLRHACSTNNLDLVQALLDMGVNPNCYDDQRRSPLHLAACRGYADVVKLLLDKGANPNQRDSLGNTPLHLAACTNNLSVVTLLLKAGTDVSSLDLFGRNPLQLAQAKLKLLQRGSDNEDSKFIKGEVQKVIDMMMAYLQKKGQQMEMELLTAFSSRVTLSNSKEEVETDVRDLLASLNNLTLDTKK